MKNSQKGYIAPLLIAIIVLLVIGGTYVYEESQPRQTSQQTTISTTSTITSNSTADWKNYQGYGISFKYSPLLVFNESKSGGVITLSHSIAYKHADPCDFKGGSQPLDRLTDLDVSLKVINQNLKDLLQSSSYPGWDYVSKNPFTSGSLNGYMITEGVEGCRKDVYYFPISQSKTLAIERALITEFDPIIGDYKTYLALPETISPEQGKGIFAQILSSVKVQ